MTVTDPDVPDPLNDPRTMQADPGAYGQGADLASGEDDPARPARTNSPPSRRWTAGHGRHSRLGRSEPEPEIETGGPFTQVAPPT